MPNIVSRPIPWNTKLFKSPFNLRPLRILDIEPLRPLKKRIEIFSCGSLCRSLQMGFPILLARAGTADIGLNATAL